MSRPDVPAMARRRARRTSVLAALVLLGLVPAYAQAQMGGRGGQGEHGAHGEHGEMEPPPMAAVRSQYEAVRNHVLQVARNVPEDVLSYRPTEEVRSVSELLGHIANASYAFCSAALGEASPNSTNFEEIAEQAMLVEGLEGAFAYCDRAHAELRGPRLMEEVTLFGQTGTRLWVLMFNATHDWEHYGNLVTYIRLNGLVPPSSGGMTGGR